MSQEALDLAVKNARVGVRLATASLWTVFAALLFTAVLAFARAWGGPLDVSNVHGFLIAIGATQVWLAIVLGGTIVYHGQRRAALARLEQLRGEV